jgi:hypothetical protein
VALWFLNETSGRHRQHAEESDCTGTGLRKSLNRQASEFELLTVAKPSVLGTHRPDVLELSEMSRSNSRRLSQKRDHRETAGNFGRQRIHVYLLGWPKKRETHLCLQIKGEFPRINLSYLPL